MKLLPSIVARTPGHPPKNAREPRKNGTVLIFLFPLGEGSGLVLNTTSQDHGDILTGFVRVFVSGISL